MSRFISNINFNLTRFYIFFIKQRFKIIYILVLFGIYWLNTFHTNFPDEFDNIVGGWYITQGKLPYIGFFSHHNPGAYVIAALITLITHRSFVGFRMIWSILLFFSSIGGYWLIRSKCGKRETFFYAIFLLFLSLSATYYWGHMLLSETVVGYLFLPAYVLFLIKGLKSQKINLTDIVTISILTSLALLTSFTFLFAIGIFLIYCIYLFIQSVGFSRKLIQGIGILVAPYVLFVSYLLISHSFTEYVFQAITYNKLYYIYNFPIINGQVSTNPLRYAVSIFYNTNIQFHSLLVQLDHLNFSRPLNVTLILGNVVLLIYFLTKRKFSLTIMAYLVFVYLNARGEPLGSQETDFHSTVYIMISLVNLSIILRLLIDEIGKKLLPPYHLLYKLLLVLTGAYAIFTGLFFLRTFSEKAYAKYMGQAPGIYDEPVVAPIINKIVNKNDYFWIGPFEFQELLYINGKLPSKYHWFLPAHERSTKIKNEFTADLLKNRPKLIVYKEDLSYFSTDAHSFNYPIVNFLREYYFRLEDLEKLGQKYRPTITNLHNFDIAVNFYYDKNRKEEIIKNLLDQKIIEAVK